MSHAGDFDCDEMAWVEEMEDFALEVAAFDPNHPLRAAVSGVRVFEFSIYDSDEEGEE